MPLSVPIQILSLMMGELVTVLPSRDWTKTRFVAGSALDGGFDR